MLASPDPDPDPRTSLTRGVQQQQQHTHRACARRITLSRQHAPCCACKVCSNPHQVCSVNIGKSEVKIVTNAANVEEGTRVVVACVGAIVQGDALKKKTVGGRASEGMLADAPMLGWTGGGAGAAAIVPEACAPGDRPPEKRPRMDGK